MKKLFVEKLRKITQNKKDIEREFGVKIFTYPNEGSVVINSTPEKELITSEAIEAMDIGFSINDVTVLKAEDFVFKRIEIKNYTKRADIIRVRARLIGVKGRALRTLESLTDCIISVHENSVGIIGKEREVEKAGQAVIRIIQGSPHANVYASLEKQRAMEKESNF